MPRYGSELVEIDCQLKDETDKSYLIVTDEGEWFVPKSLCTWNPSSDLVNGIMDIPTWIVEREGIE